MPYSQTATMLARRIAFEIDAQLPEDYEGAVKVLRCVEVFVDWEGTDDFPGCACGPDVMSLTRQLVPQVLKHQMVKDEILRYLKKLVQLRRSPERQNTVVQFERRSV